MSFLPLFAAIPLLLVGLTVVVHHQILDRLCLLTVPIATVIGGGYLAAVHRQTPVLAHSIGAYVDGVAIVFVSDMLSALLLIATGIVVFASVLYLIVTREAQHRLFTPLVLMLIAGVNGALLTGDLFNFFVFIEVMLLPSYALIAITGSWRRLGIGRMFVLVNLLASTILLLGLGFTYAVAGTVNLAALAGQGHDPRVALGVGVVLLAMLGKAGVVPVHSWLPRAYPATSAGMMSLFSGVHTKIGIYAIYRIYITVYGASSPVLYVILGLVVASTLVGSFATFSERRIRGALAYQMVAGVGQILIGLAICTQLSVAAGLFYMVHHMITMGALIMGSGAIEATYGSGRFDRIHGLMRREPALAAIMAFGFLSLVGLPPTSGLWGKIGLVSSAAHAPFSTALLVLSTIALASILSLLALQGVWRRVFFGAPMRTYLPDDPLTHRGNLTPITADTTVAGRLLIPPLLLVAISVAFFVLMGAVWPFFDVAAASLLHPDAYVQAVLGR